MHAFNKSIIVQHLYHFSCSIYLFALHFAILYSMSIYLKKCKMNNIESNILKGIKFPLAVSFSLRYNIELQN